MCKKLTVAYGDYIGQRLVGWCVYNGKDFGFISDKTVKSKIAAGDSVNGLTIDDDGNVVIDKDFTSILMSKSGLTFTVNYGSEEAEDGTVVNKYYALVKVIKSKGGNRYMFITNRCGCEEFTENAVKTMLQLMDMGGVKLDGKGKIVVCPTVEVLELNEKEEAAG